MRHAKDTTEGELLQGAVDAGQYIAGGYFLARRFARPEGLSPDLLPGVLVSLSHCLTTLVPGIWALSWTQMPDSDHREEAVQDGLAAPDVDPAIAWTTAEHAAGRFGWPCVFADPSLARTFRQRFLRDDTQLAILGAGLHRAFAKSFLREARPAANQSPPGLYVGIGKRQPLEPGGIVLGWEVLCYETSGYFHSWLCNGLERDVSERFSIRPASHGLIAAEADARLAGEFCRDEAAAYRAEPGAWHPWLILEYPSSQGRYGP